MPHPLLRSLKILPLFLLPTVNFAQIPTGLITGTPSYDNVKLPFEQKWMVAYPDTPAARVWSFRTEGHLDVHTTADSVGPDSALLFFHSKGTKPGQILIYDVAAREADGKAISTYKGISFWMKADGGDGDFSLGCEWNQDLPIYPRIGKFPLATKQWKKFFIPWDKFEKPAKEGGFYFLNVKLEPTTDRDAWAILSRISLYKEEKTEEITPTKEVDPAGVFDAKKFVEPSVDECLKSIPKTMAKLRAKKPVTIVATGDSITAGAQLGNTSEKTEGTYPYMYWAVLQSRLAGHYGYDKEHARFVHKMWVFPDKKTDPGAQEHFEIKTGQTPAADGTLPFDGLQVIGVGAGGQDSRFGEAHLADVTQFKPDLVIWAYGANDAIANRGKQYKEPTVEAINELKKQGIEVILASPTPCVNLPYYNNSVRFEEHAREIAKATGIPLVNQFASFNARGHRYLGDLYADQVHPNNIGHEHMASTLAAAMGIPDQQVWNRPFFKAKINTRQ
jgi:lysophospholipase L1-like esterase